MIPGLSSSPGDFPKPWASVAELVREGSHALQLKSRRRGSFRNANANPVSLVAQ